MPEFIDLFSNHAALYAKARPHYPPELFEYLAGLCGTRKLAWDVGTGNGQAAVALAAHFDRVIATDASAEQLRHAAPHPRVSYHVATAEDPSLVAANGNVLPASVDLVTIAQAIHWLNFDAFYANVRRAVRPGGIIAAWCYTLPRVDGRIDQLIDGFCDNPLESCWESRRQYVEDRLEKIPFPFTEIRCSPRDHPVCDRHGVHSPFACRSDWTLMEYLAYIESWSAVQKYRRDRGSDPLELVRHELSRAWGNAAARRTVWSPIYLRVGRL